MLLNFKKHLKDKGELYLRVKVRPGSAKNAVKEVMADETVKIDISDPPVKGKANQELIKFLAREFEADKNNIKIISGAWERVKLVNIVE